MNLSQPYYIEPRDGKRHISLDGVWDFGYAPDQVALQDVKYTMQANVPGSVFWSLYEAGQMPNPYVGMNNKQFGWVDDQVWYYRKRFALRRDTPYTRAILCLDGACYFTRVWLNGTLLGEHEGMFGGPFCEISALLNNDGDNELVVEVRACNYKNPLFTPRNDHKETPYPIIPWNLMRENSCLDGDFNVIGLWRGVRIELLDDTHLSRPYMYTQAIEADRAKLHFEVEITDPIIDELSCMLSDEKEGWTKFTFSFQNGNVGIRQDRKLNVLVELTEQDTGNKIYSQMEEYRPYDWQKGYVEPAYYECHHYQRNIELDNPKVWMPSGMGKPYLYTARVALYEAGALLDELFFTFGVRTVTRAFSAGDKFRSRWDKFQFIVNDRRVFIRGVNWMPIDHFLNLKQEEYRWSLERVRDMGVTLIRVWSGGGIPETDEFYNLCDELGLMVWQDHAIANTDTPNWNYKALLNQVSMNLFRIRNHPSLVIHCGGNEFNPYSTGNLASISVIEHAVQDLDPCREWVRTTPDRGSAHIYMDMEPCWYRKLCRQLPFLAESGIHSFPSFKALKEVISQEELERPLSNIFTKDFEKGNPELRNHFVEFIPERIPRMLSRASAINDIQGISLENLVEATQIASMEFYQVMIESLRENYPVTTGIMPWVYRRPSVAVGVQLMDGAGYPIAPYYAVRNAYQPLSVSLDMGQMTFKPGQSVALVAYLLNGKDETIPMLTLRLEIYAPNMRLSDVRTRQVRVRAGIPVEKIDLGEMLLTQDYNNAFFFLRLTLLNEKGPLCRKFYWPRCLSLLEDEALFRQRSMNPQPNLFIRNGPWLKRQIASSTGASLKMRLLDKGMSASRQWAKVQVTNEGSIPAFPVVLDGETLPCVADDNYFALMPGEERTLQVEFFRKDKIAAEKFITARAWNTPAQQVFF